MAPSGLRCRANSVATEQTCQPRGPDGVPVGLYAGAAQCTWPAPVPRSLGASRAGSRAPVDDGHLTPDDQRVARAAEAGGPTPQPCPAPRRAVLQWISAALDGASDKVQR